MTRSSAVGDILPSVALRRSDGGGSVGWRDVRHVTVAVFLHPDCSGCDDYLRRLGQEQRLPMWGGRILAIEDAPAGSRGVDLPEGVLAVTDPDGQARRVAGVPTGTAAVLVVDRFGQVFARRTDEAGHDLPSVGEVFEEVRFISVQCPECEVPDVPPGL